MVKTATSRTGEASAVNSQSGFTLFEVLIVLAIIALVTAAAILVPRPGSATAGVKSTAFSVAALLRHARSQAIVRGHTTSVLVDLSRRVIRTGKGSRPVSIARGVRVSMKAAASQRKSSRLAGIRFFS